MMKRLCCIGSLFLFVGSALGCSDAPDGLPGGASREDHPSDDPPPLSSSAAEESDSYQGDEIEAEARFGQPLTSVAEAEDQLIAGGWAGLGTAGAEEDVTAGGGANELALAGASDPNYIVFLLPLPGSRLFNDVQAFLLAHPSQATNFPPHVSVTGFFFSSLSPAAAGSVFRQVVISVGTPFGAPPKITSVHCKSVSTLTTTGVVHNWLIDLHVAATGKKWRQFQNAIFAAFSVPKLTRRDVSNYHITLFEAPKASVSKATFKSVCTAAKTAFAANVKSGVYNNARWGTALFEQAGAGVVQVPNTGFQVAP